MALLRGDHPGKWDADEPATVDLSKVRTEALQAELQARVPLQVFASMEAIMLNLRDLMRDWTRDRPDPALTLKVESMKSAIQYEAMKIREHAARLHDSVGGSVLPTSSP